MCLLHFNCSESIRDPFAVVVDGAVHNEQLPAVAALRQRVEDELVAELSRCVFSLPFFSFHSNLCIVLVLRTPFRA